MHFPKNIGDIVAPKNLPIWKENRIQTAFIFYGPKEINDIT